MIERMTFAELLDENKRLREALETISQVAAISDGAHWYALIAEEALTGEANETRRDVRPLADKNKKKTKD